MQNNRDLVLRLAEAEQALVDGVNAVLQKHALPCYLLEPIVDKIHKQLIDGKAQELAAAKSKEEKEAAK